jgi:transposase
VGAALPIPRFVALARSVTAYRDTIVASLL